MSSVIWRLFHLGLNELGKYGACDNTNIVLWVYFILRMHIIGATHWTLSKIIAYNQICLYCPKLSLVANVANIFIQSDSFHRIYIYIYNESSNICRCLLNVHFMPTKSFTAGIRMIDKHNDSYKTSIHLCNYNMLLIKYGITSSSSLPSSSSSSLSSSSSSSQSLSSSSSSSSPSPSSYTVP